MPELSQVPEEDRAVDFDKPTPDRTYPLKEMSTGRFITENGALVYVDENGEPASF
jgi:hypothetical protein